MVFKKSFVLHLHLFLDFFFFRILKELVAETDMEVERQRKREPPLPFRGAAGGGTVFYWLFFSCYRRKFFPLL